jgi:hypothetical protein
MDEPTRRAWSKPELIVIVRSGPEEAVLGACKHAAGAATAKGSQNDCFSPPDITCGSPCESIVGS